MRIRLIVTTLWLLVAFFLLVWVMYGHSGYLMAIQAATDREVGEEPSKDRLAAAENECNEMFQRGTQNTFDAAVSKAYEEAERYDKRRIAHEQQRVFLQRIYVSWVLLAYLPVVALFAKPVVKKCKSAMHKRRGALSLKSKTGNSP